MRTLIAVVLALAPAPWLLAQTPAATTQPAPVTTAPTTRSVSETLSSGDPKIDAILDRLESKGQTIQGLSTVLIYNEIRFEPVEEKVIKRGELFFRRGEPNARFMIRFDETVAGGVIQSNKEYYLFDGGWFIERNDRAKSVVRRQIVRPDQRIDPFKLGSGPFPLPFGQRRTEILANFVAKREPPRPDDPPDTDHINLVPRPNSELSQRYRRVDMYIDRRIELPVRIEIERLSDDSIVDVRFERLDPNDAPADSRFQIDRPTGKDWDFREEPLPPDAPPMRP